MGISKKGTGVSECQAVKMLCCWLSRGWEGSGVTEWERPLEAGKDKEMCGSLEPLEGVIDALF